MDWTGHTVRDFTSNRKKGSEISKLPGLAISKLVQKLCREEEVGFEVELCWEG